MGLFSSKKSSTKTTTNNTFNDNRQVNDAGGGVIGSGTVDNSLRLTDASRSSTSTTITYSDAGALKAAQQLGAAAINAASKGTTDTLKFATKAQSDAAGFNVNAANKGFSLAGSAQTAIAKSNAEALSFARDVLGQANQASQAAQASVASAYAGAADSASGNKTLVYAGLAAVAVIGLALAFRS